MDFLRAGDPQLNHLLSEGHVMVHPFVIGEGACGTLMIRAEVLSLLQGMPSAPTLTHDEVLEFISHRALMGKGLGYVDVHLLTSVSLADNARIWTTDRKLNLAAQALGLAVGDN